MYAEHVLGNVPGSDWEGYIFRDVQDFLAFAPPIWLTLIFWWNLIVKGAQPKTRYCGHVNSRLMHCMSEQDQTNRVSYYKWGWSTEGWGLQWVYSRRTLCRHGIWIVNPPVLCFGINTMTDLPGFIVPLIGLVGYWLIPVSNLQVHGMAGHTAFGPVVKREDGGLSHRGWAALGGSITSQDSLSPEGIDLGKGS